MGVKEDPSGMEILGAGGGVWYFFSGMTHNLTIFSIVFFSMVKTPCTIIPVYVQYRHIQNMDPYRNVVHGPLLCTVDLVHGPLCGPGQWTTPVDHPLFSRFIFTRGLSEC